MCDGIFILEKAEEEEYDGNKNKYICSRWGEASGIKSCCGGCWNKGGSKQGNPGGCGAYGGGAVLLRAKRWHAGCALPA